jgi:hypothetical protein
MLREYFRSDKRCFAFGLILFGLLLVAIADWRPEIPGFCGSGCSGVDLALLAKDDCKLRGNENSTRLRKLVERIEQLETVNNRT